MTEVETFEHSDMVLAATMSIRGIEGLMSRKGDHVVWTYPKTEDLSALVATFRSGDCAVEPLAFARMLRNTRNRVYDLMGYNPPRVLTPASESETS